MLDVKKLRTQPEEVQAALAKRKKGHDLTAFLDLDAENRRLLQEVEALKAKQNAASKDVPRLKKEGKDTTALMAEMKLIAQKVRTLEVEVNEIQEKMNLLLLSFPNTPNPAVPEGEDDTENEELRRHLTPTEFSFPSKPHWELGQELGILDPETAAKITGARFTVYRGLGARLERALINFMLDTHVEKHGYTEVMPPFIVNRKSMTGTGQLPKFEEDMFRLQGTDYFLIPTAEVPVTNLYADMILEGDSLPIKHCAYTACFRAEAGSAGRDTRGLIRQHQFNKVELVQLVEPEESYQTLERLTADAEEILKLLGLPYRVVRLCAGDLGFSSAMTYDIEVWMPSYNRYVEISSCSNFEGFQARRANIRYKKTVKDKAQPVHTLNGSGLAVGRTVAAILENYQEADGSVRIPEVLIPYMRGAVSIHK